MNASPRESSSDLQARAEKELAGIQSETLKVVSDLKESVGEKPAAELVEMHRLVNELFAPNRFSHQQRGSREGFVSAIATGMRGFADGLIMGQSAERYEGNMKLASDPYLLPKVLRANLVKKVGNLGPTETYVSNESSFETTATHAVAETFSETADSLHSHIANGASEETVTQMLRTHEIVDEIIERTTFTSNAEKAAFVHAIYATVRSMTHGLVMGSGFERSENRAVLAKNPGAMSELMRTSLREATGGRIGSIETSVSTDVQLRTAREGVGAILRKL